MSNGDSSLQLEFDTPLAAAAVKAIHTGDAAALTRLLMDNPGLATARLGRGEPKSRTLLHILTDWPGNFPNGPQAVAALVEYGADVNAQSIGSHTETPLHWAASCDVAVLDALLNHGADIEASGACVDSGTPLADAVAFGQWKAARRLIERGAIANLWQAAGLGLMKQLNDHFANAAALPKHEDITNAFWCACHGGQREAAEYLLAQGAEINWVGHDNLTPLDAANRSEAKELAEWLITQGAVSHKESS